MTTWNHTRKGRIEGEVVRDDGEFVDLKLTTNHRHGARGETITVRKSFLTEVPEAKEAGK